MQEEREDAILFQEVSHRLKYKVSSIVLSETSQTQKDKYSRTPLLGRTESRAITLRHKVEQSHQWLAGLGGWGELAQNGDSFRFARSRVLDMDGGTTMSKYFMSLNCAFKKWLT